MGIHPAVVFLVLGKGLAERAGKGPNDITEILKPLNDVGLLMLAMAVDELTESVR